MKPYLSKFAARLLLVTVVTAGGVVATGTMASAHTTSKHAVRVSTTIHTHHSTTHTVWRGNTPWG
ncbi:hypothetical protein DQ384_27405 [Sphaerisporangium album]|uniref:Uncharacterized protein n=1 Tax=Sphaerisporangium album TaxID=509200 RepID=A0A367FBQ1_9ACTN|nr:hypothetical protein [Sphaerisporangium album]RCG27010.1 hypothetical protein DQ384_27405 [Sphaerisporangium album]